MAFAVQSNAPKKATQQKAGEQPYLVILEVVDMAFWQVGRIGRFAQAGGGYSTGPYI